MRKIVLSLSAALMSLGMGAAAAQTQCGTVTIAAMNWQSAEILAALDKFILETGYGCVSSMVSADTLLAITSMVEKEQPDLVPEGWVDLVPELFNRGLEEGKLVVIGDPLPDGGQQGLFIPKYVADQHPEIKTISDAFAHPELFPDPEDPSKGAMINAPQSFAASVVATQIFKAHNQGKNDFTLIDPGSAAGLDGSIARAYERGESFMAFAWEPTSLLGRYEMVYLEDVPHDAEEWARCTSVAACEDPKPNVWPRDKLASVITAKFDARAPQAVKDYLGRRSWDNKTLNGLLAWMAENQATGEQGAAYFLQNYPQMWRAWVPEEVANKIAAAL